jgi:hypothetical protein
VLDLPELNLSVMLEVVARDRRGAPLRANEAETPTPREFRLAGAEG